MFVEPAEFCSKGFRYSIRQHVEPVAWSAAANEQVKICNRSRNRCLGACPRSAQGKMAF